MALLLHLVLLVLVAVAALLDLLVAFLVLEPLAIPATPELRLLGGQRGVLPYLGMAGEAVLVDLLHLIRLIMPVDLVAPERVLPLLVFLRFMAGVVLHKSTKLKVETGAGDLALLLLMVVVVSLLKPEPLAS